MICENAYYIDDNKETKPKCKNEAKVAEDEYFKDQCPLVYFCMVSGRYEQTTDMFYCKYRSKT